MEPVVERRKYPRHKLNPDSGIKATLILAGRSMLQSTSSNQIEIRGLPVDIGRGGVCVEIPIEAPWQSLVNRDQIELVLEKESYRRPIEGRVVNIRKGKTKLGVQFAAPVGDLSPFLLPRELYRV